MMPFALILWEGLLQLARALLNVALLIRTTGPGGSQSSGAAWKADPSTPRLQQERPPVRKGEQGHGQESEATPAYKPSLAEVIPERTTGAAETAKSCRPSMSARKRQGVLMMTLG